MSYNQTRAPEWLKDAFLLWISCVDDKQVEADDEWLTPLPDADSLCCPDSDQQAKWDALTAHQRADWLCIRALECCDDPLPLWACNRLGLPQGAAYAVAARKLRDHIPMRLAQAG